MLYGGTNWKKGSWGEQAGVQGELWRKEISECVCVCLCHEANSNSFYIQGWDSKLEVRLQLESLKPGCFLKDGTVICTLDDRGSPQEDCLPMFSHCCVPWDKALVYCKDLLLVLV